LRSIVCGVVKRKLFGKLLGKCFNVFKSKKKNMRSVSKTLKQKIKTKTKKSECSEQR
jgi:F420-0:gamma-glutamyl ligase-like protein